MKLTKRTYIAGFAASALLLSSCLKGEDAFDYEAQFEREKPIIAEFVEEHLPEAEYHENTGIWYQIIEEGDEESYEYKILSSGYLESPIVTVKYTGKLLNGTEFDSNDEGYEQNLSNLIPAWGYIFYPQKIDDFNVGGITEGGLQPGDKVRIITPSYWGYRDRQNGQIPPNSPLDFTLEVVDIESPSSQN